MFLKETRDELIHKGLPHASGDVSSLTGVRVQDTASSPCEWGCFSRLAQTAQAQGVFPMRVGMFLSAYIGIFGIYCLPHASGDVSACLSFSLLIERSSPCEWGCFLRAECSEFENRVFPMRVGMFLTPPLTTASIEGLPHASGDVSNAWNEMAFSIESSPCEWGCFFEERFVRWCR